jgi:hypothetical protein
MLRPGWYAWGGKYQLDGYRVGLATLAAGRPYYLSVLSAVEFPAPLTGAL